jgi:2-methylisocitrate lyase-like PEP mutase family enzyme
MIKRIAKSSNLPLTVDLEAGYSDDPIIIAQNLIELAGLGVSGVNLEDSNIQAEPKLIAAEEQANKFKVIKETLASAGVDLFINARINTYIMGFFGKPTSNALEESLKRIKLYEEAGVDGVFIPFLSDRNEISEIVKATKLPVNVSVDPDNMDIKALAELGVKRVSMGNILLSKMMMNFESYLTNLPK